MDKFSILLNYFYLNKITKKISKVTVLEFPTEHIYSISNFFGELNIPNPLSDFDEHITSTVRGFYLLNAIDLPQKFISKTNKLGIIKKTGYMVDIHENSYLLDNINGNYCVYYKMEYVLTTEKHIAIAIARLNNTHSSS